VIRVVPETELRTSGSWLTSFFVGFTFMVLNTGYTAVVTTQLLEKNSAAVNSLQDAISQSRLLCCQQAMAVTLMARYPSLSGLLVPQGGGQSIPAMDRGECYGAIVHADEWQSARMFGNGHCRDKVRLAETISV
jgi:hypothetical protein